MRGAAALVVVLAIAACEREEREFVGPSAAPQSLDPASDLIAGDPPVAGEPLDPEMPGYKETAFAISEGRTLYLGFNCVGCHANGGGAIGPAFIDSTWFYGSAPYEVATSILSGRPRGMPSYRGKLVRAQVYQLTAFVRSLGGLTRGDAVSSRPDDMMLGPLGGLDEYGMPTRRTERP